MSVEIESKIELDVSQAQLLLDAGVILGERNFLNVYYDDAELLQKAGATFRIRFEKGRSLLSLKLPFAYHPKGGKASLEIEHPFKKLPPAKLSLPELPLSLCSPLEEMGASHLKRLFWTRCKRQVISLPEGILELDQVSWAGRILLIEAEVEEKDDVKRKALTERILRLAPKGRISFESKFKRSLKEVRRWSG